MYNNIVPKAIMDAFNIMVKNYECLCSICYLDTNHYIISIVNKNIVYVLESIPEFNTDSGDFTYRDVYTKRMKRGTYPLSEESKYYRKLKKIKFILDNVI